MTARPCAPIAMTAGSADASGAASTSWRSARARVSNRRSHSRRMTWSPSRHSSPPAWGGDDPGAGARGAPPPGHQRVRDPGRRPPRVRRHVRRAAGPAAHGGTRRGARVALGQRGRALAGSGPGRDWFGATSRRTCGCRRPPPREPRGPRSGRPSRSGSSSRCSSCRAPRRP